MSKKTRTVKTLKRKGSIREGQMRTIIRQVMQEEKKKESAR